MKSHYSLSCSQSNVWSPASNHYSYCADPTLRKPHPAQSQLNQLQIAFELKILQRIGTRFFLEVGGTVFLKKRPDSVDQLVAALIAVTKGFQRRAFLFSFSGFLRVLFVGVVVSLFSVTASTTVSFAFHALHYSQLVKPHCTPVASTIGLSKAGKVRFCLLNSHLFHLFGFDTQFGGTRDPGDKSFQTFLRVQIQVFAEQLEIQISFAAASQLST